MSKAILAASLAAVMAGSLFGAGEVILRECYDGRPDIEWIEDTHRDPAEIERYAKAYHEKFPMRLMGYRHGKAADGIAGEVFKAIERATGYRAASCLTGDAGEVAVRFAAQAKGWRTGATYAENADGTMRRVDARPPAKREWVLDWSDEFDGTELNTNNWSAVDCWHCQEEQFYTSRRKNVRVEDGKLVLEAHRERFDTLPTKETGVNLCGAVPGISYVPARRYANYTSGCVVSAKKAAFTYGRIEIRAKIPVGKWSWPALWMMGENIPEVHWPRCGEIDIMEYWGRSERTVFGTCHFCQLDSVYWADGGNPHVGRGDRLKDVDVEHGFHTYAIEWDRDRMDFFFDGTHYFTFPLEIVTIGKDYNAMRLPMYILMNYALDPEQGPVGAEYVLPSRFEIDYVRHYHAKEATR